MILSLVLGDGCLHYIKTNGKYYGGLTIDHGIDQNDYCKWKAELLTNITNRNVKVRTGHKGKSIQISVAMKRFKVWRKFLYPNGKKDISKILKFINNPKFAIAVWLMDDGYVEPSFTNKKLYSASFRIFTCETPVEGQEELIKWFNRELGLSQVKVRYIKKKKTNKTYPFLKINTEDSLKLWGEIREFVLQFKSMQYKFRHIESIYQKRMAQRKAS